MLYSFWIEKIDDTMSKLLPEEIGAAAANLSNRAPREPIEQSSEIAHWLMHVDRVVTVIFEPSPVYADGKYNLGVMHGIVQHGSLTIAVVLSSDTTGVAPVPEQIGARGAQ